MSVIKLDLPTGNSMPRICDHNPRGGTLERMNGHTMRCAVCGKLFMVGRLKMGGDAR